MVFLRCRKETVSITGSTTYRVEEEASEWKKGLEFLTEIEATERYSMEERISEARGEARRLVGYSSD